MLLLGNEEKTSREDQLGLLRILASFLHLFYIRALPLSCKKKMIRHPLPFCSVTRGVYLQKEGEPVFGKLNHFSFTHCAGGSKAKVQSYLSLHTKWQKINLVSYYMCLLGEWKLKGSGERCFKMSDRQKWSGLGRGIYCKAPMTSHFLEKIWKKVP